MTLRRPNLPPLGRVPVLCAGLVVAAATLGVAMALAAGPELDPSFDDDGRQITDVAEGNDFASGLAIQDDDKVVLVGFNRAVSGNPRSDDAAVVRYEADGDLDTTFAGDGILLYEGDGGWQEATAVAIDANDDIVVAGGTETLEGSGTAFTALRLDEEGDPDPGFGEEGAATVDVDADVGAFSFFPARALAIQDDGKIVLAGAGGIEGGDDALYQAMAITRLESDGIRTPTSATAGSGRSPFPASLPTNRSPVAMGWRSTASGGSWWWAPSTTRTTTLSSRSCASSPTATWTRRSAATA